MATVKRFADTSSVSLAYGITDVADPASLTLTELSYIPFTQEGFSLSKDSQESTAIRNTRRSKGGKNTAGTAAGSAGMEFGLTPFIDDMLSLSAMNEWKALGLGTDEILTDGDTTRFFMVEKRVKANRAGVKHNDFQRFFGNLVNEATIDVGDGLIGFSVNTMAAFGDVHTADAALDDDAGGLVTTYVTPADYEVADASNNIQDAIVADMAGAAIEANFSDFSIAISNNVREQRAVGNQFAAGMGMGKVACVVSGTIYYYDNSVLKAHLDNGYMSFECKFTTADGTYLFKMPRAKVGAPSDNAGGENQDYTQSITLTAEEGELDIDGEIFTCAFAFIKQTA